MPNVQKKKRTVAIDTVPLPEKVKQLAKIRFKIAFERILVPQWWRIAYLIPDMFHRGLAEYEQFVKIVDGSDTGFNSFILKNVKAYLETGKMPPSAIKAPILNIAEDIIAGREPIIRAGDYISLQNAYRG